MSKPNKAIGCSIKECEYHFQVEPFCSLSKIHVGSHESCATTKNCTDCNSFKPRVKDYF